LPATAPDENTKRAFGTDAASAGIALDVGFITRPSGPMYFSANLIAFSRSLPTFSKKIV
jgi:hypothetical protein